MSTGGRASPPTAGGPSAPVPPRNAAEPAMTDPARSTPRPARRSPWLSLGPASRLLGVDPDTLRRWSDAGRVPAWTTPGGHRRFERGALERLAAERRPGGRPRSLAHVGASPAQFRRLYRRHYASADAGPTTRAPRDPDEREAYRRDGRRLVEALIAYLDAGADDAERDRVAAVAESLVHAHAARLERSGHGLTESVALFVTARQPFLAQIAGLGRRRSLDPVHLAILYEDAAVLLDRLLLRFVAAHQGAAGRA